MTEVRLPILPVASPCESCGACCLHVRTPPFYGDGDPSWQKLQAARPDLEGELWRWINGLDNSDDEAPCFWFDHETRGCKHHEHRPDICREFDVGRPGCAAARTHQSIKTDWYWTEVAPEE